MLQLSLTLERPDVRAVDEWEDYMNGKSSQQRVWHARDDAERPKYEAAYFSKPVPPGWSIPGPMLRAVAVHLQTRQYNDDDMRRRQVPPVDMHALARVGFMAWDAYTSDSDDGSQRYRCVRTGSRTQVVRSAGWATVSIFWTCYHPCDLFPLTSIHNR